MNKSRYWLPVVGVVLVALAALLLKDSLSGEILSRQLPNGTVFRAWKVVVTATNYDYEPYGPFARKVIGALPPPLRNRLSKNGAAFHFGSTGHTNLLLLASLESASTNMMNGPQRIRVLDENGVCFDVAYGGAQTTFTPGATHLGWHVQAFPRRSRFLDLRFLQHGAGSNWSGIADLRVKNPLYGEYPQWTAEPLPATRTNQNLAVELREFKTGMRMTGRRGQGDEAIAARATRVVFAFAEHGKVTEDFRVREIAISDATGNNWRPSLDLTGQDWNWATNGTAHFFGNLWPSESAWKLRVEVIRESGFPPEDQWELSLRLPMRGELYALTNRWQHNDEAVQLVALGSPKAEHTGAFKPLGSWWYDGRNEVYSLALSAIPATEDQIVTMVRGVDQNGEEVKSVGQSTVLPTGERVLFFKPETSAIDIKLTLALQRSHFVEFLARPEFLNTVTNSAK